MRPEIDIDAALQHGTPHRKPWGDNMVWVPGGTFRMGSNRHYPEEAPAHRVAVAGFWIDRTPVTNSQFARFVAATGHVTFAEIPPDPKNYPVALPHMLYAGSLVFRRPLERVQADHWGHWWNFMKGADWRHPWVLAARSKASATILWFTSPIRMHSPTRAGPARICPREAEWEFAARGGEEGAEFAWGDELTSGRQVNGQHLARSVSLAKPGAGRLRAHVSGRRLSANDYGLYDMIGNVWEWTSDWFSARHQPDAAKPCCIPKNPRGGEEKPELRSLPARKPNPAQGAQGRILLMRAKLLQAL